MFSNMCYLRCFLLSPEINRRSGTPRYSPLSFPAPPLILSLHAPPTRSAAVVDPRFDVLRAGKAFGSALDKFPDWVKPRLAAMAPNGPVSKMLASHSVAMKVTFRRHRVILRIEISFIPDQPASGVFILNQPASGVYIEQ